MGNIVINQRTDDWMLRFALAVDESVLAVLSELLRRGQRDGEFRDLDPGWSP